MFMVVGMVAYILFYTCIVYWFFTRFIEIMVEERKEIIHVFDTIEPLLIKGDFEHVNEIYKNTNVDITTTASLVSMMSIMIKWKKHLNKNIVKDFYDRVYERFLKKFSKEEVKSIFEGWDC